MYRDENEIRKYIEQIKSLCDLVLDSLGSDEDDERTQIMEEFNDFDDFTEFEELEEVQDDYDYTPPTTNDGPKSKKIDYKSDISKIPYLVRRRTGEKILINRNIFKIGKEESYVDYCIKDNATVSRNHADIVRKSDGFYVKDMGSLNHTFVNGVKLQQNEPKKLESGYLIQLADEVFEWHCD
jgi:hypothetical protein